MLRRQSIRMRIIVLVLVPVIALMGLYAVALSLTLSSFLSLERAGSVRDAVTNPATNVQLQLSNERGLALEYMVNPSHARLLRLLSQESSTDDAIRSFASAAASSRADASTAEQQASRNWLSELSTLHLLRGTVASVTLSTSAAADSYSTLIGGADLVLTQAVLPVLNNSALIQANGLLTMEESLQSVAEERDVFAADLTNHAYLRPDLRLVDQLIAQHQELWNQAIASLGPQYLTYFTMDIPADATSDLAGFENRIQAGVKSALRIPLHGWTTTNAAYAAGFRTALRDTQNAIRQTGISQARGVLLRLILIGGLGLCAIIGAIAVAIILSRALVQQLDDLRLSALELSTVRLPVVLARLRSGEEVDVGSETPQLEPGSNEIGQLGRAFNLAARTAVSAAADEADIRRGVNDVFRNLARRNQSLLTRQLELLDSMERRVDDPEELADLFRVDHLTTRMRRHAEGLLIVAGGSSGRVWRDPVPIVDVMRAAVAEIEDYTRIRVTARSSSSVAGHAVADVIHLLAELVENATTFSPANTPVRIESDNVAKGLIVEIEDRGLGMSEEQIQEINTKLNDPPLLDLSGSEQLGLFIAGQLARRHEVKITMRGSAYGGIIAVVLIPSELVIDPGYDEPLTIVGIRELGGRPVPQLPAPATPTEENAPVGALSATGPEYAGTPGYLVDLETAATTVTTTAAQVVSPGGPDIEGTVPGDLRPPRKVSPQEAAAANLTPADVISAEVISGDIISGDIISGDIISGEVVAGDLAPADAATVESAAADPGAAGDLKGAGAWLVEAGAADHSEPGVGSETPKLMFGPTAEHPVFGAENAGHQLGATGAAFEPPAAAGLGDHSVGWPTSPRDDRTRESPSLPTRAAGPADPLFGPFEPQGDWAQFPGRTADSEQPDRLSRTEGASAPVSGSVGWPGQPATPSGGAGNGTSDEAFATGTVPLLPRRPRAPGDQPTTAEVDGLPVRVRQASLAPQLRDQMATTQPHEFIAPSQQEQPPAAPNPEPSPEAARSFMSSLQRGWERGRSMAEQMTEEPDPD